VTSKNWLDLVLIRITLR